jgi:branched-subunit amino acid transport protein
MVAGGIAPLAAMAMSLVVYAGASMLVASQLLAAGTPLAVILLTVLRLPALLRRALPFVPAAVLTAVWAPELLLPKGVVYLSLHNDRLLAGAVAIVVAWRWRLTFATIASGLIALHLFDWLL